jgi:uncharacterized protein (DUF4415 family)
MSRKKKEMDENPAWTKADFRNALSADRMPDSMARFFPKTRRRGPQKAPKKVPVSIRLSEDVVAHFKSMGRGWQKRIDEELKKLVDA